MPKEGREISFRRRQAVAPGNDRADPGRIIAEAKLEGITPYSLRHTFLTELLRAGADLRYVMDKAGHRKLTTTTRYLHSVEDDDSPVRKIQIGKKPPRKLPSEGHEKGHGN